MHPILHARGVLERPVQDIIKMLVGQFEALLEVLAPQLSAPRAASVSLSEVDWCVNYRERNNPQVHRC